MYTCKTHYKEALNYQGPKHKTFTKLTYKTKRGNFKDNLNSKCDNLFCHDVVRNIKKQSTEPHYFLKH